MFQRRNKVQYKLALHGREGWIVVRKTRGPEEGAHKPPGD